MDALNNEIKNEQMLLYIANKLRDCSGFGSIMLNKVLFYSDATCYLKTGRSISGFEYIKQKRGHTPSPKTFIPLREKMVKSGAVEIVNIEKFGKIQKRIVAKKQPQLLAFSQEEIAIMDEICNSAMPLNATQISNYSHHELGWQLAEDFETIPKFTYLLTNSEINEDDIAWAKNKISLRTVMSDN